MKIVKTTYLLYSKTLLYFMSCISIIIIHTLWFNWYLSIHNTYDNLIIHTLSFYFFHEEEIISFSHINNNNINAYYIISFIYYYFYFSSRCYFYHSLWCNMEMLSWTIIRWNGSRSVTNEILMKDSLIDR